MATRLKNIVAFPPIPAGGSIPLPHLLNVNGNPVRPDVFAPSVPASVRVTVSATTLTVKNLTGAELADVFVLVEHWHTIEREFGDVATLSLSPQPFELAGGAGAAEVPVPAFVDPTIVTIYARPTGSDSTGDGTLANPYGTYVYARRQVPTQAPPLTRYVVDIDGIDEVLPVDYVEPFHENGWTIDLDFVSPDPWVVRDGLEVRATPVLSTAVPAPDAQVSAAEIVSITPDPENGLLAIKTTKAWAVGVLKGAFFLSSAGKFFNATVYDNDADTIYIAYNDFVPSADFTLNEAGARLRGTSTWFRYPAALSVVGLTGSFGFKGVKIENTDVAINQTAIKMSSGAASVMNHEFCDFTGYHLFSQMNPCAILWSYVHDKDITISNATSITHQSFYQNITSWLFGPLYWGLYFTASVADGCPAIGPRSHLEPSSGGQQYGVPGVIFLEECLIENPIVDGTYGTPANCIRPQGAPLYMQRVSCNGSPTDAIYMADGLGFARFVEVHGSGNAGYGLFCTDGNQVKADAATDITGTSGDMKVGDLAPAAWATDLPQYDITAVGAGGATGTGSRVYLG